MAGARAAVNPLDAFKPAGKMYVGRDEGVAQCMLPEERPPTPEHYKSQRRITEPGVRVLHVGYRGDPTDDSRVFGSVDRRPPVGVSDAMNTRAPAMTEFVASRAESLYYKSARIAPLGKGSTPGAPTLPASTQRPDFAFGSTTDKAALTAKDVIFPISASAGDVAAEVIYERSHGSYAAGVQNKRAVDWSATRVDPASACFGKKSSVAGHNEMVKILNPAVDENVAATRIIPKPIADFALAEQHQLGRVHRTHVLDTSAHPAVYGRPSRRGGDAGEWGAADCLRGDYGTEEMLPDADLGVTVPRSRARPGVAAASAPLPAPERRFGVPSIRTDVPARSKVSISSGVDFGGGGGTAALLAPNPYAENDIDESDFTRVRSADELRDIFSRIGYAHFTDAEFRAIYERAASVGTITPRGCACVEEVRRVIDEVMECRDVEARNPTWMR